MPDLETHMEHDGLCRVAGDLWVKYHISGFYQVKCSIQYNVSRMYEAEVCYLRWFEQNRSQQTCYF